MREFTYQWNPESYTNPEEPVLKITKSSFGTYQWCPKKFEFQYIQRLPYDTTEAMIKGTVVHNVREQFFRDYDVKKAEDLSFDKLIEYNMGLHPIDDYGEIYNNMAAFEASRFVQQKEAGTLDTYLPVINEVLLDAEIVIPQDINPKVHLDRDYIIHMQGIIDRIFIDDGKYVPLEFKTGPWKDSKTTSMRKELAFYKLLVENAPTAILNEAGIDRDIPITHWGWYYPVSNYMHVEPVKKQSLTAVYRGITKMIKSFEEGEFEAKYYYKKCEHCSYQDICPAAIASEWV